MAFLISSPSGPARGRHGVTDLPVFVLMVPANWKSSLNPWDLAYSSRSATCQRSGAAPVLCFAQRLRVSDGGLDAVPGHPAIVAPDQLLCLSAVWAGNQAIKSRSERRYRTAPAASWRWRSCTRRARPVSLPVGTEGAWSPCHRQELSSGWGCPSSRPRGRWAPS